MKSLLFVVIVSTLICLPGLSQPGRVGINTPSPQAMLHVRDSMVLFTGASNYSANPGNIPNLGNNAIAMLWYPDKAAFRMGKFSNLILTKEIIGNASFTVGENCVASGANSFASGWISDATGMHSVAIGGQVEASGFSSFASGGGTRAIGSYSHAFNQSTTAIGISSTTSGLHSVATGNFATAMGLQSYARSYMCFVAGAYNDSIASSSTDTWVTTDPLFIIGNGTAIGGRNNAITVLKDARTGINISNPFTTLHVRKNPSGLSGPGTNVVAFFENNASAFLQLASPTANEAGILSSNPITNIRSAIVFTSDSAISLRSGGNNTRFQITKTGELTKPGTGSANLVPVCYGSVAAAGTINSGSSNFSVVNSATGQYDITITGENYLSSNFATSISVISGTTFRIATTGASGGDLIVRVFDINGTLVNSSFHFIVFKP